ncbi:MAG: hypothetical protein FWD89_01190, partial [Firmicutes bacterium]|nr:hypothetical protein [Bacillota bacterium]
MRNKKTEKIFVEVKVPIRSCVVCRGKAPKEELKKIPTDKQGGKGAYVHKGCIDAIKTKKVL